MAFVESVKKQLWSNQSDFTKNVLTLITGTSFAQALQIASIPILTRLYAPNDFGIFAIYAAIVGILAIIVCGKYDSAIMLPKKDEDAINVMFLSTCLAFLGSFLLFLLLCTELFSTPANWAYIAPVSIFLIAFNLIQINWASRNKRFKLISMNKVFCTVVIFVTSLIFGLSGHTDFGLILGILAGQVFTAVFLGSQFLSEDRSEGKDLLKQISAKSAFSQAKKYIHFPKINMWTVLVNAISLQAPVLLLSSLSFGIVGFYSLVHRVSVLPVTLVGNSFASVFHQKIAENKHDNEKIKQITYKMYKKLLFLGITPFSILLAFGDVIFSLVFGSNWIVAGQYTQCLSLFFLFMFVSSPMTTVFLVKNHKQGFATSLLLLASRVLPLLIGLVFFENMFFAILLFAIISTISRFGFCLYILKLVKVKVNDSLLFTLKTIIVPIFGLCLIRFIVRF